MMQLTTQNKSKKHNKTQFALYKIATRNTFFVDINPVLLNDIFSNPESLKKYVELIVRGMQK